MVHAIFFNHVKPIIRRPRQMQGGARQGIRQASLGAGAAAAAGGKSSQNHHALWVSEVTLGIFGVQFWGFSVLHCHGVCLSGDQQEEKVAKLHIPSSSKRKKPPKSSFSMGFRSYVRHFGGAILGAKIIIFYGFQK